MRAHTNQLGDECALAHAPRCFVTLRERYSKFVMDARRKCKTTNNVNEKKPRIAITLVLSGPRAYTVHENARFSSDWTRLYYGFLSSVSFCFEVVTLYRIPFYQNTSSKISSNRKQNGIKQMQRKND